VEYIRGVGGVGVHGIRGGGGVVVYAGTEGVVV
jgi:hypothetical protein